MQSVNKLLVVLAAIAFVLAVLATFGFNPLGKEAEGYSFACTNLALLAIASHLLFK